MEAEFHARQGLKSQTARRPCQAITIGSIGNADTGANERIKRVSQAEVILSIRQDCDDFLLGIRNCPWRDQIIVVV